MYNTTLAGVDQVCVGGGGRKVMGGSDISSDPHLEGQTLILTSQRQSSVCGPKFVLAIMEDKVARMALRNFQP